VDTVLRSSRWLVPIITIENVGGYDAHNFLVHCVIDSFGDEIYRELVEVDTLLRHQTRTVPFPAWMVGPDGAEYGFKMYHDATGDGNPTNDTLSVQTRSSLGMLRIAIEIAAGSRGRIEPNACYAIDVIRVGEGWGGGLVAGEDLDEWEELINYDVVVTGDDGFSDNDFAHYDDALLKWVKRGGGFVGLGWLVYGIYNGPGPGSPMDSVSAAKCNREYAYVSSGQVRPLSNDHEITQGVNQFTVQDYGEYPQGGLWDDAVMLGDYTDNPSKPSIAYKLLGEGRSVYLGPAYFADFASHQTEPYFRDGNAIRLLVQSIKWAASGPGVGVADAAKSLLPARTGITDVLPNPLFGQAVVRYSLARPGNVSLAVYDLAGQKTRTLVSGHEQAGQNAVTWNRTDDAGRRVPAGVYFCRFEAEEKSDTWKLVVR
ncbi:MAG: T9SS type A sorting domain-containing protein, partial [candidate division WOR-3 bacterium]